MIVTAPLLSQMCIFLTVLCLDQVEGSARLRKRIKSKINLIAFAIFKFYSLNAVN